MKKYKIFVSSSYYDLKEEREQIAIQIARLNKDLAKREIFLELLMWETQSFQIGQSIQEEINSMFYDADVFILLIHTTIGRFTAEEYEIALRNLQEKGKPKLIVFFKDTAIDISEIDFDKLSNTEKFKNKVKENALISYFDNISSLKLLLTRAILRIIENDEDGIKPEKPELKDLRVFISYNHKDNIEANKIKDELTNFGFQVIIDSESMFPGADIETFIKESILNSDITLSLISTNSILSSWVAMETIESFNKETSSQIKFLPVVLEGSFFERKFTGEAIDHIDIELEEIVEMLKNRFEKKTGFADLYGEFKRYLALRNNIDEIVRRLRESLSIDVSSHNFNTGFGKVLDYLNNLNRDKVNNKT